MKDIKFKNFTAQLSGDDDNYVEGYASIYGNIDRVGDIVERGAFTKSLDASQRSAPVRFLWQHKPDHPIGTIVEFKDTPKGLWFKARFSNNTAGQDAREAVRSGAVDRFSIGYTENLVEQDMIGRRRVKRLKEINLWEVSIVTFPANELAVLTAVKSLEGTGQLSEENRALLLQMANMMLAAQNVAAPAADPVAEDGPTEPVEGEEVPEGDEDAAKEAEATEEAPEGEKKPADEEVTEEPAEEEAETEDKPVDEAAKDEADDEEDEKAKKKAFEALETYLLERQLAALLAKKRA